PALSLLALAADDDRTVDGSPVQLVVPGDHARVRSGDRDRRRADGVAREPDRRLRLAIGSDRRRARDHDHALAPGYALDEVPRVLVLLDPDLVDRDVGDLVAGLADVDDQAERSRHALDDLSRTQVAEHPA